MPGRSYLGRSLSSGNLTSGPCIIGSAGPMASRAAMSRPSRPRMSSASATMRRFGWACGAAARMLCAASTSRPSAFSTKAIKAEDPCHTVNEQRVVIMLPDAHKLDQVLDMMALGKTRTGRGLGDIVDLDTEMPFDKDAVRRRRLLCRGYERDQVVGPQHPDVSRHLVQIADEDHGQVPMTIIAP